MSAWRIFSQFWGRCVVSVQPNSLPITLITLIPHTRCKAGMVLVVISMIMIVLSSLLYFAAQEVLKRKCVERTLGNVTLINFVAGGVSEHWAAICVSPKHSVEKQKAGFDVSTFTPVSHYHYPTQWKYCFPRLGQFFSQKPTLKQPHVDRATQKSLNTHHVKIHC